MAAAMRLVSRQGDCLEQLIWRDAGLGPGEIGRVLDANPGLADLGTILPLGTVVLVPATPLSQADATRTLPLVQLWS